MNNNIQEKHNIKYIKSREESITEIYIILDLNMQKRTFSQVYELFQSWLKLEGETEMTGGAMN